MARQPHIVKQGIMRHVLAPFLDLKDLAHFEIASSHAKSIVEKGAVWVESARKALPSFRLDSSLLEPPQRAKLLAWFPSLLRVAVGPELSVALRSIKEAERISKLLSTAEHKAASHISTGGKLAQVVIGQLRFPTQGIAEALDEVPGEEHPATDPVTVLGVPIRLRSSEGCDLQLHFAMQHGKLLVSARDDDLPSDIIEPPGRQPPAQALDGRLRSRSLTLDITGISPSFTLQYKGLVVPANGPWQVAASGIFAATRGKAAAVEALASGAPCVFHCRDGTEDEGPRLVHSLHLDMVRR